MSQLPAIWFIGFEAVKLLVQLVGAIIIARLAVGWALNRYKAEKTWERRMAAYLEAIQAVSRMEALTLTWLDRELMHRNPDDKTKEAENAEYQAARKVLINETIAARLLFPEKTAKILEQLHSDFAQARQVDSLFEHMDNKLFALKKAKNALIEDGRAVLSLDSFEKT